MKHKIKSIFCRHKNKIVIAEDTAYRRFKLYICPDCGKTCSHYHGDPPKEYGWKWNYSKKNPMTLWKINKEGKIWIDKYLEVFGNPFM